MFHAFTYVHLCILTIFAVLGLKALITYRNHRVSFRLVMDGVSVGRVTYSDVVLLFSVLSFMSLDSTSVEFIQWMRWQLQYGPRLATLLVTTTYLTTLVCAVAYTFGAAFVILRSSVMELMRLARKGPGN